MAIAPDGIEPIETAIVMLKDMGTSSIIDKDSGETRPDDV